MSQINGKIDKDFCLEALHMADNERGKPTERERNRLFGLSTVRQRCLLNNLCSKPNTKFLEIGLYKGSTFISALFDNPTTKGVGVEHYLYDDRESPKWAPEGFIWDNMKSHLEANMNIYRNEKERLNTDNIEIIESAFEDVDWSKQPKFDVVHFDVMPIDEKTYDDFFNLVVPSLATDSVVVFTQQSNQTYAKLLNEAILKHSDKVTEVFKEYRVSNSMSDSFHYYSGILMIGFKKKIMPSVKPKVAPKANTTPKATGAEKQ